MASEPWPRLWPSGTLIGVIPVVQTETHGQWTATLVSLERWDASLVANLDINQPGPLDFDPDQLDPRLVLAIGDELGGHYQEWFEAQTGGPLGAGYQQRAVRKVTPLPAPVVRELRIEVRLQFRRMVDGSPEPGAAAITPEPWTFVVPLPPPH